MTKLSNPNDLEKKHILSHYVYGKSEEFDATLMFSLFFNISHGKYFCFTFLNYPFSDFSKYLVLSM